VQSLAPPDLFSTPAGKSDLGADLWKDTSPDIARDVLPKLAAKPLSPAFAELARKVLATGANAPPGIGDNPDMGAARALGLLALGDAAGADMVLDRAPGLAGNASLSLAAAEAALIKGDDDKACGDRRGPDRRSRDRLLAAPAGLLPGARRPGRRRAPDLFPWPSSRPRTPTTRG
jgi:hypothetical protein